MQPSLLHTWEALQPNCNQIHTVTKIKKKTSRQKAILCSSPGPDQGLLLAWEAFSDPSPRLLLLLAPKPVPPRGPHSVLSSSGVSSVGCWRLGTWCLGLPLVHPPRAGSTARHPPGASWKVCGQSSKSTCPEHGNSGRARVFSHSLYCPHAHCRAEQHTLETQRKESFSRKWNMKNLYTSCRLVLSLL